MKETEADSCRRWREEVEIREEGEESEMGLEKLHEMGERDGWLKEGESGNEGLMVGVDMETIPNDGEA